MVENSPQDCALLMSLYDNKTSCESQNPSTVLETCVDPYESDYMQINFKCSHGKSITVLLKILYFGVKYLDITLCFRLLPILLFFKNRLI